MFFVIRIYRILHVGCFKGFKKEIPLSPWGISFFAWFYTLHKFSQLSSLRLIIIILSILVIISIDNTIRLAMYSNRFLIKTMQMVGATRSFIAKPMNIRAVINGLISAGIAIFLMFILIQWAEGQFPQLATIRDTKLTIILFGGMVLIGVGISLFSTHRSVIKYLKMSLDDLY